MSFIPIVDIMKLAVKEHVLRIVLLVRLITTARHLNIAVVSIRRHGIANALDLVLVSRAMIVTTAQHSNTAVITNVP